MAAKRKSTKRSAPSKRKAASRKAATRKSATRTSARKKSAAARASTRKSAGRKSATRKPAARVRKVTKVVQAKARQGLELAKDGLERLKTSTAHLVEEVKERIGREDEPRRATETYGSPA